MQRGFCDDYFFIVDHLSYVCQICYIAATLYHHVFALCTRALEPHINVGSMQYAGPAGSGESHVMMFRVPRVEPEHSLLVLCKRLRQLEPGNEAH